jgi:signal transduction histidine kinase
LSSARLVSPFSLQSTWLYRWIYYLASGFLFSAAALRAYLILQDEPSVSLIMLVLAAWLALFIGDIFLAHRSTWSTAIFITVEAVLIMFLLLATEEDFFACLFAILGMQAMQRYSPRIVAAIMLVSALLTFGALFERTGFLQALALSLVYTTSGAFMTAYIWSTRRATIAQDQEQKLMEELQAANERLELHARQKEQLAAGRERQRLARELHDSVTQTIFSMTLTTQSTLLLLDRDPSQVAGQLDRLTQLAQSAMSEMQELISHLAPQAVSGGGLVKALHHHLEERQRIHNLEVKLDVDGNESLAPVEESGLFRIAQEALNNIVKHAGVTQATIRLHLAEPVWMEVEDQGAGFDLQQIPGGRMGLAGMRERAAEIGWCLQVESKPEAGTRIRVQRSGAGVIK